MSKKYIESMNEITVDDKLRKRILEKVSQINEQENNNIRIIKNNNINKFGRRSISIAAACCAFVVCTGLNSRFPEIFNVNDVNLSINNEEVQHNNLQVNDSNILENDNKYEVNSNSRNNDTNNNISITDDYCNKDQVVYSDNIGKENKREENVTKSIDSQISNSEKSVGNSSYVDINGKENKQSELDNSKNEIENYNKEMISNNDKISVVSENNNGKEYLQNDMTKNIVSEIDSKHDMSASKRAIKETDENMNNVLKAPEALKNNYEITYTLAVSDDSLKVGYKDKEYGNGEITISSEKHIDDVQSYSSIENVKTSKGAAVIKISKNGKEKYADWENENIYYTLCTEANVDNEKIIHIIESCI